MPFSEQKRSVTSGPKKTPAPRSEATVEWMVRGSLREERGSVIGENRVQRAARASSPPHEVLEELVFKARKAVRNLALPLHGRDVSEGDAGPLHHSAVHDEDLFVTRREHVHEGHDVEGRLEGVVDTHATLRVGGRVASAVLVQNFHCTPRPE